MNNKHSEYDEIFKSLNTISLRDMDRDEMKSKISSDIESISHNKQKNIKLWKPMIPAIHTLLLLFVFIAVGYFFITNQQSDSAGQGNNPEFEMTDLNSIFKDPAVREAVFGDDAEILKSKYIGAGIYHMTSTSNSFLVTFNTDKIIEVFTYIKYIRQKGISDHNDKETIKSIFEDSSVRLEALGSMSTIKNIHAVNNSIYKMETAEHNFLIQIDDDDLLHIYKFKESVQWHK
ncbi:hypothetical protein ACFFIS_05190 [Virgibacillus soli]